MTYRIFFFCCFLPVLLTAQQNEFNWRLGVYGGIIDYSGDLSYKFIDPNDRLTNFFDHLDYTSFGVSVEGRISNTLSFGMMYTQGQFIANDRTIDWSGDLRTDNPNFLRSLNVRTDLRDLGFYLTLHTDNGKTLSRRAFLSPYFKVGAGLAVFESFGDLFYGPDEDQRYYYWDDFTVRDRPPGSQGAQIIEQDGIFETELGPLQTEGEDYSNQALSLSAAFGLKFRLGSRFNLNLELLGRYLTTDFLDDVGGRFPDEYESDLQRYASNPANISGEFRGDENGRNDIYLFTSISLHYNFGRNTRAFTVPAIAVGPLTAPPLAAARTTQPDTMRIDTVQVDTMQVDTIRQVVVDSTVLAADSLLLPADDSLQLRADSLQYVVDSLQRRIRILMAPADSLLADSLRQVADSLYMRADSLYPMAYDRRDTSVMLADSVLLTGGDSLNNAVLLARMDSLARSDSLSRLQNRQLADSLVLVRDSLLRLSADTVFMASQADSLNQEEIADLEARIDELSDSLLITRTQLEAAQAYEPLPDTLAPQQKVAIYDDEIEDRRSEIEEFRATVDDDLSPEQEARISAMEEQLENYESTLQRMERSMSNNSDDYKDLEKEIERLRKQLNITTGVGAAAGLTAAVAGGGESKEQRKEREAMEARMAAMQAQIDSLNRLVAVPTALDTIAADSARMILGELPMDTISIYDTEGMTSANDSLRAILLQQRNQALLFQAQRDSLQAELAKARRRPELQRRQAVYFAVNSSALSPPARRTVEEVAEVVKQYAELSVYLEGYTDPSGSADYNRALAQRRAQSVRDYLVQLGIPADRVITVPQGEDNTTTDPTLGRRVDLILRGQE